MANAIDWFEIPAMNFKRVKESDKFYQFYNNDFTQVLFS